MVKINNLGVLSSGKGSINLRSIFRNLVAGPLSQASEKECVGYICTHSLKTLRGQGK